MIIILADSKGYLFKLANSPFTSLLCTAVSELVLFFPSTQYNADTQPMSFHDWPFFELTVVVQIRKNIHAGLAFPNACQTIMRLSSQLICNVD